MRHTLLLPLLLLLAPLAVAQHVTRPDAVRALNGDCLRVGNVGYPITLDHDLRPQLELVTGAVRNQRIIPATDLLSAPAGWIDGGTLIDVDHREYHLFVEPMPQVRVCQARVLGVKVERRSRGWHWLLAPLVVLRVFGLNSRGEYDQ